MSILKTYGNGGKETFEEFMKNNPNVKAWRKEFVESYGEEPRIEGSDYDYRGAWKAGVVPEPTYEPESGQTKYHWGSIGLGGKDLKSKDHPTRWKSDFMKLTGINPDEVSPQLPAMERDKPSILQMIDPIQKEKDIQSGKLYDAEMKEKRRAEIQAGVESGKMFEGKTYSPFERQMAKQVSEKQMRSGLEDPEVAKKIGLNLLETAMLPIEAGALNKLPEFLRYRGMKAPKHSPGEGIPWQPIQRGNYLGPEKNNRWLNPKGGLGKMERGVVDTFMKSGDDASKVIEMVPKKGVTPEGLTYTEIAPKYRAIKEGVQEGVDFNKSWFSNPVTKERYRGFTDVVEEAKLVDKHYADYIERDSAGEDIAKALRKSNPRISNKAIAENISKGIESFPLESAWKQSRILKDPLSMDRRLLKGVQDSQDIKLIRPERTSYADSQERIAGYASENEGFAFPYDPRTRAIIDKKTASDISTHEGAHRWQKSVGMTDKLKNELSTPFKKYEDVPEGLKHALGKDAASSKKQYNYITNENEIHSRLMEMRKNLNLKPGEQMTQAHYVDEFNRAMDMAKSGKRGDMLQFLSLPTDVPSFLNMANKVPAIGALGLGAATVNQEYAKGGKKKSILNCM